MSQGMILKGDCARFTTTIDDTIDDTYSSARESQWRLRLRFASPDWPEFQKLPFGLNTL